MKVPDKTIVVTGGGSGIGRQLVLELLARGARVAAVDLNAENLQATLALVGANRERLSTHVLNIADLKAVEALPKAVIDAHGSVDGVINNAGIIQKFVPFKDLSLAEIERVMNINFYGAIYMIQAFLPYLLQRPAAHIVNIASMGSFLPVPGQTIYGSSKAAVKLFTEGLDSELSETNVRVTVVFPGAINTNITVNSGLMTQTEKESHKSGHKMTNPDVAARTIVNGIEKDKHRLTVGPDAAMMDLLSRLAPVFAATVIYRNMTGLLTPPPAA